MKVLLDTNVLLDYYARRHPFDRDSALILFGCAMGDYEVWVSSSQITDVFYLMKHADAQLASDQAVQALQQLRQFVRVASLTEQDVDDALASGWSDFEDACVYFVAKRNRATYLLTRNKKDFRYSEIPVVTPSEFLELLECNHGISYQQLEINEKQ